jgi:hypothetical protein
MRPSGDDGESSDRAAARDQHPLAQKRPGPIDGVQRHRQRLGESRLVDRDVLGDLVTLPFLGHQALPERALDVRHRHGAAVKAHVQALVLLPLEAVLAALAGSAR